MASESGHDDRDLIASLPETSTVRFFDLCLALERARPQPGGIGGMASPQRETVRFRANPTLGFPSNEVERVETGEAADRLDVTVNLLGLHGPASPLPPSFTERIVFAEDGSALRDFSDFFNHRLVSLLYRIWKHYRHHHRYQAGATDPISAAIAALFGQFGLEADGDRPARTLLLPYTGLLSLHSRSAAVVAGVLMHYFGVPCRIEEFVVRTVTIPPEAQWRLGAPLELGVETLCGETIEDVAGKFRIRLGALTSEQCDRLMPGGADHGRLGELIRLTIREPLDWDVAYVLAPGEARPLCLGETRLGRSGWLDVDPTAEIEFVL